MAARWLAELGFAVLERNVETPAGELDLIALDGDTLCFIEVKARAGTGFGTGAASVTGEKRRRLVRAASWYLERTGIDTWVRFDVLVMEQGREGWHASLLENAFEFVEHR